MKLIGHMLQVRLAPRALLWPALVLLALPSTAGAAPTARSSATCSDYSNQADAQRAGDTRDADGDRIYCEALLCPCLKPGSGRRRGDDSAAASPDEKRS